MKLKGRVWCFGDDIDTDIIIPARYLNQTNPEDLKKHLFEPIRPELYKKIAPGDIILAGENFGCGSSREHAPLAIKAAGISAVIAKSFARIFYRNALNIGMPVIVCPELTEDTQEGDIVVVDIEAGEVRNCRTNQAYTFPRFEDFMIGLINTGGLIPCILKGGFINKKKE